MTSTVVAPGTDGPPPPGESVLLLESAGPKRSSRQDCDARTALVRGLAEYTEQLKWVAAGGRELRFKRVRQEWSEVEERAKWPSLVIYTIAPGTYDYSGFTPQVNPQCQLPAPDGRYLVSPANLMLDLVVEIWANDPAERAQFAAMLEYFYNPVLYRSGFQLRLPYYFGMIGTYSVEELTYEDAEDDAHRRIRKALFSVSATVQVTRLVSLPLAKPRFELRDIGTGADVLVQFVVE